MTANSSGKLAGSLKVRRIKMFSIESNIPAKIAMYIKTLEKHKSIFLDSYTTLTLIASETNVITYAIRNT